MKILHNGSRKMVIPSSSKISDSLEAGVYSLEFSKMSGFSLVESSLPERSEKMFGKMPTKVDKIFDLFKEKEGNVGILLSGDKGMGKSMFMRLLAKRAVEEGLPVIKIEDCLPGVASFISQVETPVMWLLDEFEKNFHSAEDDDSIEDRANDTQNQFLSLLDGTSSNHHIFIVTCNNVRAISEFFLNRPGRFYYHFKFYYPGTEEIKEYLDENLRTDIKDADNIKEKLLIYSKVSELNYDALSSIVTELNRGYSFDETLEDLNVTTDFSNIWMRIVVETEDGEKFFGGFRTRLSSESDGSPRHVNMDDRLGYEIFQLDFLFNKAKLNKETGEFELPVDTLIEEPKYETRYKNHKKGEKVKISKIRITDEADRGFCASSYFSSFIED